MNTTENNKLLAEFIGMKIITFKGIEYVENAGNLTANLVDDLEAFTYDWNWLMQVVEKIDNVCGLDLHEWDEHINNALCSKSLHTTYNACLEFINWYNENSAKQN